MVQCEYMTGVTRSTSQRGSFASGGASPRALDLRSWQGLTEVLKLAREGGLTPEAYGGFRDLVLQYAQQGGDVELRKKIDAIVATFKKRGDATPALPTDPAPAPSVAVHVPVTPAAAAPLPPVEASVATPEAQVVPASAPLVGVRRRAPSFLPKSASSSELIPATPPESPASEVVVPTPSAVPEPPVVAEVPDVPPSPQSAPTAEPVASTATFVPDAVPTPSQPVPAVETPVRSILEHRTRIAEIKRVVNALVGNPVTLVNEENTLGRTYMTALLNAMKSTAPGSTMNVEASMRALEEAFAAIEAHVATHRGAEHISATHRDKEQTPVVIRDEVPARADAVEIAPEPTLSESSAPITAIPSLADAPQDVEHTQEEEVTTTPAPTTPTPEVVEEEVAPQEPEDRTYIREAVQNAKREFEERASATVKSGIPSMLDLESVPEHVPRGNIIASETHAASNVPVPSSTLPMPSDLMSREVTSSLSSLLNDWSIFASSGLFGIGPGGMDHPLYKKLSVLPMGEIVTGRYEGARLELTHTIKDYVDAWRHEQGIAYNPQETFEQYLRRVVQRILKRQTTEKVV